MKGVLIDDSVRAIAASGTVATHEPSQSALSRPLRVSVELSRGRAVIRPWVTSRTHKPPVPRGHRSFILERREWR